MDWLDKHMPEGKRIRDELNSLQPSNVLSFRKALTAQELATYRIMKEKRNESQH